MIDTPPSISSPKAKARYRMRQGAYKTHRIRVIRTTRLLQAIIVSLESQGQRVSKTAVARASGISREQINKRYAHLFLS